MPILFCCIWPSQGLHIPNRSSTELDDKAEKRRRPELQDANFEPEAEKGLDDWKRRQEPRPRPQAHLTSLRKPRMSLWEAGKI